MGKECNDREYDRDYERDYERDYDREKNCCCDREEELRRFFKRYKGQPVEIITESGFKYCGIDVEAGENAVTIIDCKGRTVMIEYRKIEAVIEPRMKLQRLCGDNDCCCKDHDDDCDERHHKDHDCDCCADFCRD